jgi:hypothetical protein
MDRFQVSGVSRGNRAEGEAHRTMGSILKAQRTVEVGKNKNKNALERPGSISDPVTNWQMLGIERIIIR